MEHIVGHIASPSHKMPARATRTKSASVKTRTRKNSSSSPRASPTRAAAARRMNKRPSAGLTEQLTPQGTRHPFAAVKRPQRTRAPSAENKQALAKTLPQAVGVLKAKRNQILARKASPAPRADQSAKQSPNTRPRPAVNIREKDEEKPVPEHQNAALKNNSFDPS